MKHTPKRITPDMVPLDDGGFAQKAQEYPVDTVSSIIRNQKKIIANLLEVLKYIDDYETIDLDHVKATARSAIRQAEEQMTTSVVANDSPEK